MKDKQFYDRNEYYTIGLSALIVIALIIVVAVKILQVTIEDNINNRVTTELEFLAKEQTDIVNKQIRNQFERSTIIADMIEKGIDFSNKKDQRVLSSIRDQLELCMLGYADRNGNVINYMGEEMGSISARQYFREVCSGEKENSCQYIPHVGTTNEPRVLFSAPVRENGTIKGVVFFSKEIDSLRESLFHQSLFGDEVSFFIVDKDGNILVKNEYAKKKFKDAENLQDICCSSSKWKTIQSDLDAEKSDSTFLGEKKEDVIAYSNLDINGWNLICVIDKDVARVKYAPNLVSIRQSVVILCIVFCAAIVYFALLIWGQIRAARISSIRYRRQYKRIIVLLQKINCVVCEYSVETGKVSTDPFFKKTFGYKLPKDFFYRLSERKIEHPEFDYEGLRRELYYAIEHQKTTSFETIYFKDKTIYEMFSIVMMPFLDEHQKVTKVLAVIRETGADHKQLKRIVDMFNQIPGGTHRCYLSDPIHLEYAGEGLCKMLGYTVEEFYKIVGNQYINIIVDEDKHLFEEFVMEAASSPGVRSCEYRMRCKDGTILQVVDTMESVRQDSGVMYGISAVTDISEYAKQKNIIRQEMEQLEQKLEITRIKNSTSQMQPHFLYNSLASIREIILEDPQYASDLICDFTIYLRACVRTMQSDELIPISQEIDNIRAYVNIEKMRMGDRLKVVYDLQSEEFKIVPLALQPLVENAIRHGIYQRGRAGGTVRIKTRSLAEYHRIEIEDDGVGFDYQKVRDEVEIGKRDSTGLDNVVFRLTKQLQTDVVVSSEVGVGTKITVCVPK